MIVADVTIKLSLHRRKHGQRYINPAYVSLTTGVPWLWIDLLFLSTEANSKKKTSERDAFLTQSTSSRSSYRWMGQEGRVSMRRDQSKSTRSTRLGSSSWNWCATARRRTEETVCLRLSTNDSVMISNCSTRHDEKESYWIYVMSRLVTCRSKFGSVVVQGLNRGRVSKLESQSWAHILMIVSMSLCSDLCSDYIQQFQHARSRCPSDKTSRSHGLLVEIKEATRVLKIFVSDGRIRSTPSTTTLKQFFATEELRYWSRSHQWMKSDTTESVTNPESKHNELKDLHGEADDDVLWRMFLRDEVHVCMLSTGFCIV